jgi:hypothetical protein
LTLLAVLTLPTKILFLKLHNSNIISTLHKHLFSALVFALFAVPTQAQFCDAVTLTLSGQTNLDFTYDTFGKYLGGITQNGVTRLRINVNNSITSNPDCRWNLVVYIENGSGGTPNDEWESVYSQSLSGTPPKVDMLQLRITNRCNTSQTGTQFFNVPVTVGQAIMVITNTGITTPAGACTTNVNGPGNSTTNYDEYNFDIDYRLQPGVGLKSGIYQLKVRYVLAEAI